MREPLLDPRMMGVVSFDFYCKHKSITFISLANGYCFLHIASFANHRSICTLSWCALGESSNLCPLAWNDKKNDENQMTWKGTMDLYPFQFSCMYLRYHELCEAFCEVGSFSYQNSDTKSAYFVWVFMLLIIHTKMETSILLQNLFNLSVKGNAIIAKCAMRDSKK